MRRLLPLVLLALPTLAPAHFLWATLDPATKTVSLGLQETPTDSPLPLGERAARVAAWGTGKKVLALKAEGAALKSPTEGQTVGASLDYGVLDKTAGGRGLFWLKYYAKAAATAAASQVALGLPVELSAQRTTDGRWLVTVRRNGKPASGADLTVEGEGAFTGKTGPDGTATLPASSRLAVRALVTDDKKGKQDGKPYDLVRSYSTLTVGGAAPTLTRQLQIAFGDRHEAATKTAFIQTVLNGKVTKAQAIAHLQQRALVHVALDRVLGAAKDVPYGPDQKAVLTFIQDDLKAMNAEGAAPTPLTADFIREIEASAAKGPYFALGVFHVYYGGITNGGRFIGQALGTAAGYTPTYYEKSDGYHPYLAEVDRITDSQARAETVRGGLAAYRFILATNNEAQFKTP